MRLTNFSPDCTTALLLKCISAVAFLSFFFAEAKKGKVPKNLFINMQDERCTDCWCLPEEGPDGECPPLEDRQLFYGTETISSFMSFSLELTPFEELPHLVPVGGTPVENFTMPSCTPFPILENILMMPLCEKPDSQEGSVCAYFYDDDVDCDSCTSRKYGMKTYHNHSEAQHDGAIVTHEEGCGVCSNAMDLAVWMQPDLDVKAFNCALLPDVFQIYGCMATIGFTPDCAWLWTTNVLNSHFSGCTQICLENGDKPPNDPITCELNECLVCDDVVSGDIFNLFSGRTRRRSGIITQVIRDCSSIANINQDPCA